MPMQFEELNGLSVSVDQVVYLPHMMAPPDKPHPFAYYLSIHNESDQTVTILGRKWIVKEEAGSTVVVEGDGVVGHTPILQPGQTFSYNSYHVVSTDSIATGTFFGQTDHGKPVLVRVPEFKMELPE